MEAGNEEKPEDGNRGAEVERAIREAMHRRSERRIMWIVVGCGLVYGGFTRTLFAMEFLSRWLGGAATMTFLFLAPFAMGALVAFLGMTLTQRRSINLWGVAMPTACLFIGIGVSVITGFEALFCVLVAVPMLWPLTILGGVLTALIVRKTTGGRMYVSAVLLLPYAVAPLEQSLELPEEILTVENRIEIDAPRAAVWERIASVPAISPKELPWSWVHALGFPKPIAAVLEGEGVGAVRIATFERGVSFYERVTEWAPGEAIGFSIDADPQFVPANAFDQHVIVGGRFYDVLDGRYEIRMGDDGSLVLRLSSRHRLNTHLGRYASWWSGRIMNEIQGNILEVIRKRTEAGR